VSSRVRPCARRAILVSTRAGQINSWSEGTRAPDTPPNRIVSGDLTLLATPTASGLQGTTQPDRQIRIGTHLTSIVVDSTNRGYAAELSNAICSFDGINSLNGEVGPTRRIEGSATVPSEPFALALVE